MVLTKDVRMRAWLSERRRSAVALAVAVATLIGVLVCAATMSVSAVDGSVFVLLAYMATYLAVTVTAFAVASTSAIEDWGRREERGTLLQRYVLGTAPGPGVSLFFASAALIVAMVWLPGHGGGTLPDGPRVAVAGALIVVGWASVAVSYAVTFYADNIVESGAGLEFPDDDAPQWSDYIYFAISVMTTFGTTDVNVVSKELRKTVTANAVIAFVFNTVTVASTVSALAA